jgi:hypothetical protein
VQDDADVSDGYVTALRSLGWLDPATKVAKVQLAVLNGEVDVFARIEFSATFTRGGRVANEMRLSSMPANPYGGSGAGWIYTLDVVMIAYFLYLLVGASRRTLRILRDGKLGAEAKLGRLLGLWRVLDWGATASLLACFVTWFVYVDAVAAIRAKIQADAATPATYAGGPASLHVELFYAMDLMDSFKVAAVWALIFLSMRLFKYFTFQPRLAVFTNALGRAATDGAHFALLFTVILATYGVWGFFMFGPQAPDWHDVSTSATSTLRLIMYDYDLPTMATTYPQMAHFFVLSFLMLVTNLTFWVLLGILLDAYSEVRAESVGAPTILQESIAFVHSLPKMAPHPVARLHDELPRWRRWLLSCLACRPCRGRGSDFGGLRGAAGGRYSSFGDAGGDAGEGRGSKGARRDPTWQEITGALRDGSLRHAPAVTVADLRRGLHMHTAAAARLVAEAQQAEAAEAARRRTAARAGGAAGAGGAGGAGGASGAGGDNDSDDGSVAGHSAGGVAGGRGEQEAEEDSGIELGEGSGRARIATIAFGDGSAHRVLLRLPANVHGGEPYYGSDLPGSQPLPAGLARDLSRLERTLSAGHVLRTISRTVGGGGGDAGGHEARSLAYASSSGDSDEAEGGVGARADAAAQGAAAAPDADFASIDELAEHVNRVAIQLHALRSRDSVASGAARSSDASSLARALSELGPGGLLGTASPTLTAAAASGATPRAGFSPLPAAAAGGRGSRDANQTPPRQ